MSQKKMDVSERLFTLVRFLVEHASFSSEEIVSVLEKPWKWEDEADKAEQWSNVCNDDPDVHLYDIRFREPQKVGAYMTNEIRQIGYTDLMMRFDDEPVFTIVGRYTRQGVRNAEGIE